MRGVVGVDDGGAAALVSAFNVLLTCAVVRRFVPLNDSQGSSDLWSH